MVDSAEASRSLRTKWSPASNVLTVLIELLK
jgi:hypothetical protein